MKEGDSVTERDSEHDPRPDSRITIVQLAGECVGRLMVIGTSCLLVLFAVIAYLAQGFFDKSFISRVDLGIIAGLGFTTIVAYYFKPWKKGRKKP